MNFDLLPLELKTHIFTYLTVYDLRSIVAKVSKQWEALSRNSFSVQNIEIDQRFNSNEISQCITDYNVARSLKISEIFQFDWIYSIPINSKLRRLYFDECHHFDPKTLAFLSTRFPSVSKLKVPKCDYLLHYQMTFTSDTIILNFNKDFVQFFAENCHALEEIVVESRWDIHETSFQTLLTKHELTLKKICLSGVRLTDKNFNALSKCRQITDLQLCNLHYITHSQLLSLKELRLLRKLSIKNVTNTSINIIADLFMKPSFPHLQSINLRNCYKLSDDSIASISRSYPNLKSLDITGCSDVTDDGIISVINNCNALERLNITRLRVTGRILTVITSRLPHLKYLNVTCCVNILLNDFCKYQLQLLELKRGLKLIVTEPITPEELED